MSRRSRGVGGGAAEMILDETAHEFGLESLVAEVMGLVERVRDVNPDNAKLRQYVQLIRSGGLQKQE